MSYILLVIGFIFLIKGADILVDGAASLAKRIGVSSLVVGLTIVSMGTSAPELLVNIISSFQGANDIAIGNILGSNIANILLILGIAALIRPLVLSHGTVWKEIPFSLLAVLVLMFIANDVIIDGGADNIISRIDGLVFISFFIIFLYYAYSISKSGTSAEEPKIKEFSVLKSVIHIIIGIIGLAAGGNLVVNNAITIANLLGVSQSLIGLTVVAIGTSLPELATSLVASYKKNSDIAVGNIVGSNIFNLFFVLGLSAVIRPLVISVSANFDIMVVIAATILLFVFMFIGKRNILQRWQGGALFLMYSIYVAYLIFRG